MLVEKQKPLDKILSSFVHVPEKLVQAKEQNLNLLTNKIELNNPLSIIKRGYLTAENGGKRVLSVDDTTLKLKLAAGFDQDDDNKPMTYEINIDEIISGKVTLERIDL